MEKIALKDKKILFELDLDSRQPNSRIAKKVGLSKQLLGYKINQLIKKGIITEFITTINPSLLGYSHFKIYLRLMNITTNKEQEIINYLINHKNTFWIASARGRYDLIASFYAKNITEFSSLLREFLNKYGNRILDKNIVILESAKSYTSSYLLEGKMHQERTYGGVYKNIELDEADKKILSTLSQNARLNNLDIAEKLKVSHDKIRYRLKKLRENGIITGFGTKLDFGKLGYQYNLITFNLSNISLEKQKQIDFFVGNSKNIIHYINTLGSHEMEFEIEISSQEELDKLIREVRDSFSKEIKDYEIIQIIKEHKINYYPF